MFKIILFILTYLFIVFIGYIVTKGIIWKMIEKSNETKMRPIGWSFITTEFICWFFSLTGFGFLVFLLCLGAGKPIPFCFKIPKEFKKK